jgi:hypothetical protein
MFRDYARRQLSALSAAKEAASVSIPAKRPNPGSIEPADQPKGKRARSGLHVAATTAATSSVQLDTDVAMLTAVTMQQYRESLNSGQPTTMDDTVARDATIDNNSLPYGDFEYTEEDSMGPFIPTS